MKPWECPACGERNADADATCACGYSPEVRINGPRRLAKHPQEIYPWLARSLTVLRIVAYLTIPATVLAALVILDGARTVDASRLLLVGGVLAGGAIHFVLMMGLIEAGNLLLAMQRRMRGMDTRSRGHA
jgi:hypothetical protein